VLLHEIQPGPAYLLLLDYIDIEQNATFFRPGVGTVGTSNVHSPSFNMTTFLKGSDASYNPLTQLGSYLSRDLAYTLNPANYKPTAWGGPTTFNPGSAMPVFAPGDQTMLNMDAAEKKAYYDAAVKSLRSHYPYNTTTLAQLDGTKSMAGYDPAEFTQQTVASAYNAGAQAFTAAYNSAIAKGQTAAQAGAAGNLAASAAYDQVVAANTKTFATNLQKAENAAFATGGAQAGFTKMDGYFAAQRQRLTNDLMVGNISREFFNQQNARLDGLTQIAMTSATLGAFKTGTKFKGWGMDTGWQGPADRIGVKGSEDLGNGIKAVYQVELGVDLTNANRDNNIANGNRADGFYFRNTFVGLAGDWGTFLMGRHDTPLKISTGRLDLFADTLADYNNTIGFQDLRVDSTVAYISPSMAGFQLAAAIVPQGGATALGSYNADEDSLAGAFSIAAIYKNGPFYGSVAYEQLGEENFAADNANYELLYGNGESAKNDSKWRVGLGLLDWNGFSLTAIYEDRQHILGAPEDADGNYFQVQAGYAFGNNMIKGMWGRADLNRCADPNNVGFRYTCASGALGEYFASTGFVENKEKNAWAIGYDYNFSKRTQAYMLYTSVTDKIDNADWSGFSIGMNHSF